MRIISILIIDIMITGCTSYQYVASPQYVPLNNKKGELKGNLAFNSLQVGYAFSDHMSVFATGYYRYRDPSINLESALGKENSGAYSRKEKSYEVNLGTSYFVNPEKINVELLMGSGMGYIYYECDRDFMVNYEFQMNAKRFHSFLQPNVGYKFDEYFEVCVFSKLIYYRYYDLNTFLHKGDGNYTDPEDAYFIGKKSANLFFAEPGISIKAGFPEVKANLLFSPVMNLTANTIRYRELNLRLNVFVSLDLFTSKKENTHLTK